MSEKCWMNFRKPKWAHVATTQIAPSTGSTTGSTCLSHTLHQIVHVPQVEYDKFLQFFSSQKSGHTATHATVSGMGAFLASSGKFWVLDSGVSSS